ncbi:type VII secretion target [Micromonospora endophytica]|uniref:Uncharacterized protein n=1 Tax=Micromonospora endophytica TaxID=515350 RepID=A0A2W2CIV5_9ACTN|nr:type VII secretion target [Micromonospora endophytica]PZF99381.1 hypothetical protein C1I93_05840 [Micromonospora endophytica]RIW42910.1 hypothetical protein D3H59_22055 [Micromonospora endophytica]BCJ61568.1 hypothetical protein Jiend_49900 [Micromonospora endophytica]
MPPPSRDQVTVATDVLRREAGEWDRQAVAVGGVMAKSSGLELGRVEAGLFQIIVSPYNAVVQAVADRCREGQAAMVEVAQTLREVAETYEAEDLNNAHKLRNLY